ncbi:CoA ester lyase (plasmid) [Ensifer adhaerens]|uniref:HpcH/HpaI aldolase/citrate lyase family protein n=1 Tax=Ensifer adhaerens TaxID=106592 RepID=UPI0023A921AB|nr:CoA ester lyase [Ensifer adhaerens]WDZ81628.1 CoA ester lyase [Ensifer adhaerens]
MLFIPAHEERFVAKAHLRGAEAIILDLEDSVPPAAKDLARSSLRSAAARLKEHGLAVLVRVNRGLANCVADIEAAVFAGIDAVMLPKVNGPEHVALIDEFIGETEVSASLGHGVVGLLPIIETPGALAVASQIASVSPRVVGLALGTEDFSAACGFEPTFQNLFGPSQQLIFGSRSHHVPAYGLPGSIANIANAEEFRHSVLQAKEMGFNGVLCVHPAQVAAVNDVYRPTEPELAHARRIVAAFEEATRLGRGAVAVDGSMIDLPVVMRAKALLEGFRRNHA